MTQRSIAVFDLGGVLVDWNPRYLYRKLFAGDDAAMEHFLANICTSAWNSQQDAGRSFAEASHALKQQHPAYSALIDAWFERHAEMISGPISETVEILALLRAAGVPIYALSNWSAETFPSAKRRFDFLHWFHGILLSGEVRLVKPDPAIFQTFFARFAVDPSDAVYIDDLPANVATAQNLGLHAILFRHPAQLRRELEQIGLLDPSAQLDQPSPLTPTQSFPEASK
jgi:2-haloacid dehalogenase